MRTGLLLFRPTIHRQPHAFLCVTSRRWSSPCVLLPSSTHRPTILQQPSTGVRRLSSLSALSFEAPQPPKSHGQPVFPDVQIRSLSPGEEHAATERNADEEAVFVVNGSSRGIGLQFVVSLVERTKGKIVACCRSPDTAHNLNMIASKYPGRIRILPLDVENQSSIDALASSIANAYHRVDALFNVAGILGDGGKTTPGPERSLATIERGWMERTLAVNVVGPTMVTKALAPLMRTTGRSSVKIYIKSGGNGEDIETLDVALPTDRPPTVVVNLSARVGSISDNQLGGWYTYRASKAALNQVTRTAGLELRRQGTWIVALHPGTTDTDLSRPFQRNVKEGRLFPVEFTVDQLLALVDSLGNENTGGFYDWAGKALPF